MTETDERTRTEAAVVGGGIVGAATAYHLAAAGVETTLIDRADEGRATAAGAGILSPATSGRADERWVAFALEAVAHYPELAAALEREQDGPHGYARTGSLRVAFADREVEAEAATGDAAEVEAEAATGDAAEVEAFEATRERIEARAERYGRPNLDAVEEISGDRARELFPPLAEPERALYYDDAARVDGRTFTDALVRAGESRGLRTRAASVESLCVADGRIEGVVADGRRLDADAVVIAGGAWSGAFGEALGVDVPVEPQRGQIVHLDVPADGARADTADWPILSPFAEKYMVPWDDGRVAVGATRETGAGFAPHTTVAGLRDVFEETLRVAPGLADASLREARVGLRPLSPDGLPVLGAVPDVDGAYLATGHGPTGLQLGPYSGKLVAQAVRGERPETSLDPFSVERFD